jgi:hypothetical protein
MQRLFLLQAHDFSEKKALIHSHRGVYYHYYFLYISLVKQQAAGEAASS